MPDALQASGSSAHLPSDEQVIELLTAEFSAAGFEIERVSVDEGAGGRITVVVDGDQPLDLDIIAQLSRTASELLDARYPEAADYELEVTSPGIDRPLTTPAHFRRAHGRLAAIRLTDGEELTARIGRADDAAVQLVVRKPVRGTGWLVRDIALADIDSAVVQVEFSAPNRQELELAGVALSGGEE